MRKRRAICAAIVMATIAATTVARPATYYVDAGRGSDGYSGLSPVHGGEHAGPWQTLRRVAAARLSPGDTVRLKRGEIWRESLAPATSGAAGAPIVFASYGTGADPIISGAVALDRWTRVERAAGEIVYHATLPAPPRNVLDRRSLLLQVDRPADLVPASWCYEASSRRLYLRTRDDIEPAPGAIEAGQRDAVVFIYRQSHLEFVNIVAEMANGDREGIFSNGTHNRFLNCTARFNHRSGLKITGHGRVDCAVRGGRYHHNGSSGIDIESDAPPDKIRGVSIEDAACHHNVVSWGDDGYGIKLTWVDDSRVSGSRCSHNVSSGINLDGGGEPIDGCDRNVIERNLCHQNGGSGIEIEFFSNHNEVRYNECWGNSGRAGWGAGIMLTERSSDNRVYYNVVRGQGGTGHCFIAWRGASGTEFYNNLAVSGPAGNIGFYLEGGAVARDTRIKNNIYTGSRVAVYVESTDVTGFDSNHNCWRTDHPYVVAWNGRWLDLDTFRAVTGHGRHSITDDPRLVTGGPDANLRADSPCVDRGAELGLDRDLRGVGVPQGVAPDIGPFELNR